MITRKRLGVLAVITIVLLGFATLLRNDHHGVGAVFGFLTWWSFVICAVVVVLSSAAIVVRRSDRQTS
jgi:uncharacterized membrane protein YhaH (DUF805 family)